MVETKNQKAWKTINDELKFIEKIEEEGEFAITSNQIKTISEREPRLMAKFDHEINRPKIFRNNGISILPISRLSYKLLKFNSYQTVDYNEKAISVSASSVQKYQTIDINDIRSEDNAIIVANISKVLSQFTGEDNLKLTNKGKFGTGKFSFNIQTLSGDKPIEINGAGAELDAGFEGDKFYIIEAKLGKVDDFNVRQLYYPYRYWQERITKEIVPVFFTYSDNTFSLWQFEFKDDYNFNSISLLKQETYFIDIDPKPDLSEILSDIKSFVDSNPPGVPFPQADDFEKVINIVELVNSGTNTTEDFADYFAFDIRQAYYYSSAAKYLGLVDKQNSEIILTKFGEEVALASRNKKHSLLIKAILSRKVFYDTFNELQNSNLDNIEDVVEIMKNNNVLKDSTENMFRRRAQTIISWCKWIKKALS